MVEAVWMWRLWRRVNSRSRREVLSSVRLREGVEGGDLTVVSLFEYDTISPL